MRYGKLGGQLRRFAAFSDGVPHSRMGSVKNNTVMTHTQVNFSASPQPEIGVLLPELGVGLVSQVGLVSHMVRMRAMFSTQIRKDNCSTSPWPEIGVLLLELGVGLVSRVGLTYISHGKGESHV